VKDSQADISKARELLGYAPIVTFEDGLKQTVEWYRMSMTTA
jgi:UDP-glucose 4-epimerase